MPLVDYSSSSSDDGDGAEPQERPAKRARTADRVALPPLPDTFHDLYAAQVRVGTSDDPALHGGRKRTTPHVDGNWPTHIYIECKIPRYKVGRGVVRAAVVYVSRTNLIRGYPSEEEVAALEQLIQKLQLQYSDLEVHSHLRSDLGTVQPLHISLSAPLVLRTDQKDDFLNSVKNHFREGQGSSIKHFDITFRGMRWASNKDANRWFGVLRAARPPGDELNKLLELCNAVADEYNKPRLYDKRVTGNVAENTPITKDRSDCFHVSLAWTLTNPASSQATQKDDLTKKDFSQHLDNLHINCSAIKVKIGNVVHSIALSSHYENHKGILG